MNAKQHVHILSAIVILVTSLFFALPPTNTLAQTATITASENGAVSEQVTKENIAELVSNLNAEEITVLNKLLKIMTTKNAVTDPVTAPENTELIDSFETVWVDYSNFVVGNFKALPLAVQSGYQAILKTLGGRGLSGNLLFYLQVALVLLAGAVAEFVIGKILNFKRKSSPSEADESTGHTVKSLTISAGKNLLKLIAFVVAALIAAKLLLDNPFDRFLTMSAIVYLVVIARVMIIFLNYALAPKDSSKRLVSTNDTESQTVYRNFLFIACLIGAALFMLQVIREVPIDGRAPFLYWAGILIYIALIFTTWRSRHGISAIIRGNEDVTTPGLERMAAWWPTISMVIITLQFFIMQVIKSTGSVDTPPGANIITIMLIVLAPFFDTMLRGIIGKIVPKMQGEGEIAEAAFYETKHSYVRIGRVFFIALMFFVIGRLWGIEYANLAQQGFGGQIAKQGSGFLLIVAIGYLAWELINLWVNRRLAQDIPVGGAVVSEEGGGAGKSRMASVLPLIKMALQTSVILLTVLLGLSQLGLDTTPLLAGAGVFGLAIGFGAQALVKDVVSGVFFLLDDAFRVGEFIEVEGIMGTVEKISIRSLQLRHPNGPVHVIPYGEIPKLTNNSRDYVILKLRFTVPFDTNLEKVRKLFKKIGQEMMENPEHAENFIQPFKFQGVADVDDVGIVIRGKFSTKPGAQWMIRKEIYARVQKAFEENGIQFARREVRVQIPGLEKHPDLNPEQVEAIATAAGEAASIAAESEGKAPKKDLPF